MPCLIAFLFGVVACHHTDVDPELLVGEVVLSESLRPIYVRSKAVDNQLQLTITPQGPIVCCCGPCLQASYGITKKYEVQIASTEGGAYQPYTTIAIGTQENQQLAEQSLTLPSDLTNQPIVVRVVSVGQSGKAGYVRTVMNSTSPILTSISELTVDEQDNLLSLTFNPGHQQVAYVTFVQDASYNLIPTLRLADYSNGQLLNKRVLKPAGVYPVFSRDGKQLAYLLPYQAANPSRSLVIHDMNTNTDRIVEIGDKWIGSYSWSPDGQWIAFLEQTNEYTRLWKINLIANTLEALTPVMPYNQAGGVQQSTIDWSPDGKAIVATQSARVTNTDWRFSLALISPLNGSFLSNITASAGWVDKNPSYSPDGESIVFLSSRANTSHDVSTIWIKNVTTNQLRHIRLPASYQISDNFIPQWADNHSLLITAHVATTSSTGKSIKLVISL